MSMKQGPWARMSGGNWKTQARAMTKQIPAGITWGPTEKLIRRRSPGKQLSNPLPAPGVVPVNMLLTKKGGCCTDG